MVFIASLLSALAATAPDGGPANAGRLPIGWFVAGTHPQQYQVTSVERGACGSVAASVQSTAPKPSGNVAVMQLFRADKYRGTRVRFAATVITSELSGWAGLWMRIDGPGKKTLAFDNMQTRPITGTTPCQTHSVILEVPTEADVIALGLVLEGSGRAELADPQVGIVDSSTPPPVATHSRADARDRPPTGRVGAVWFHDSLVARDIAVEIAEVAPGRWNNGTDDFTASVDEDRILATTRDDSSEGTRSLKGEFVMRRQGDVTVIEGTYGSRYKAYPVSIRFSRQTVDMSWGFYERHLSAEDAPQLPKNCVFYSERKRAGSGTDALELCGAVLDPNAPKAQTVLAFLLNGFRRPRGEFHRPPPDPDSPPPLQRAVQSPASPLDPSKK